MLEARQFVVQTAHQSLVHAFTNGETTITCETSTGRPCPYLTEGLRRKAFTLTHNLSHPSDQSTAESSRVVNLVGNEKGHKKLDERMHPVSDIKNRKTRRECNRRVPHNKPPTCPHLRQHSGTPTHLRGVQIPIHIININTRWPEMKAAIGWVSRHGVPQIIMRNRGANFMSTLWNSLADSLGIKITHMTACNPEANSIIKRLHQSLKASLTTRCQGGSWR
ncbi:uncharacterized protein [Macrobrachium rosenbergii]|uniref:uncharacterized protein n=1 Tax=Macrobrachium rosenbergii TaxID=79674 RepID=UPI0034D4CFDE